MEPVGWGRYCGKAADLVGDMGVLHGAVIFHAQPGPEPVFKGRLQPKSAPLSVYRWGWPIRRRPCGDAGGHRPEPGLCHYLCPLRYQPGLFGGFIRGPGGPGHGDHSGFPAQGQRLRLRGRAYQLPIMHGGAQRRTGTKPAHYHRRLRLGYHSAYPAGQPGHPSVHRRREPAHGICPAPKRPEHRHDRG